MKAKYYLLAGLSAMMLGACSDNDDVVSDNQGDKPTIETEGKMVLNLKFTGEPSARGASFEDGSKEESTINNAFVYYFNNNNTYIGSSQATIISESPSQSANIEKVLETTVPATIVKSILKDDEANAKIIVVLNRPDNFETGFANTTSGTFDNFNTALNYLKGNAGFMMSSSLFDKSPKDNTKNYTAFSTITSKNIAILNAGKQPDKVIVYVERVCSKVTLDINKQLSTVDNAKVDLKKWSLNVKNNKVYPVKVLSDNFINLKQETWPGANYWDGKTDYRTYWAEDPNYSSSDQDDFTIIKFSDLKTDPGKPEYCLENTFDQDNQYRHKTTTAVIYAQYTPQFEGSSSTEKPSNHETWIALNNNFYSQSTFISNFLAGQNIYKKSDNKYVSPTHEDVDFKYTAVTGGDNNSQTIGGKDYSLDAKTQDPTTLYFYKGSDISNPQDEDFEVYSETHWTNLKKAFTEYCSKAQIYINGYCYYEIPIRHFTDTEVPLEENWSGKYAQKHLGRYGIVRNHSYKLTINKVLNPGKPIIGNEITPENTPDDDEPDYYMDVTINVLPWAVRSQGVDL